MDRWLRSLLATVAATALVWVATFSDQPAAAQIVPGGRLGRRVIARQPQNPNNPAGNSDDELIEGVFLPPDRSAKRRLEQARQMIDEGRYGESVRFLGSLLEGSEDYFFKPDPAGTVYRSLKSEAGRLIASMPAEGRESYELQFGAKARHLLDEAAGAGDLADVAEVSRRFFHTKAGAEASLLLARNHLDHGRPLAAALLLERLRETPDVARRFEPMLSLYLATAWLRCGMNENAQRTLVALKRERPQADLRVGGQPAKWFNDDSQALAWLEQRVDKSAAGHGGGSAIGRADDWLIYRGDARRNAASPGTRPLLNPRWRVRVAHLPQLDEAIQDLRRAYVERDVAALPNLHPLAIGNVVLMRNTRSLLAVDFETGKLVWEAEPLNDGLSDQQMLSSPTPQNNQKQLVYQFLEQRIWDDPAYGTLTSDGEQVFVVEDLGNLPVNRPRVIGPRGQIQANLGGPHNYNRLTARELKTEGKLKWEVGGPGGEDEPKLAGAFFLGPPLPLLGRLYVLAEMKGQEIRLLALSSKTGKLDWSQQLCVVEQGIGQDADRRAGGAVPSFADGVLICPTSAGAVVALDLTTRSLLWGYQYPRVQQNGQQVVAMRINMRMAGMVVNAPEHRAGERWTDGSATIVDGRVIITPTESEHMYCLNLIDGSEQWKLDRGTNLYVGCVNSGNVIVVGHAQVTAYRLHEVNDKKQPKVVWQLELPAGSAPSGRGFYSGQSYYLPLSSAEVVEIDLAQGRIASRSKSRLGEVPGNLICHRGEIISQAPDQVETFYQLDSLKQQITRKLQQAPDDPKSLTRLGEIKLDEGKLDEAIDLFRRSFDLVADDHTRDLLVSSLLDGLRADFSGSRQRAAELEKLIDQKQQRNVYLRLIAVGLKKTGDTLAAYDAYMRLLDEPRAETKSESDRSELESTGESLLVRRERWLEAELAELRSNAAPADRDQIDQRVTARLRESIAAKSPPELRKFLKAFGSHPLADEAREGLVTTLAGSSLLERELLLRRLERSPDAARSRRAVVRLATLFDEARRPELSAIYYRQLADRYADVDCLDGKTGRQIVDQLAAESAARKLLAAAEPWPAGRVEAKEGGSRTLSQPHHQRSFDLNVQGPAGPYFEDVHVVLEPQQQTIVGQDGLGNERFRAALREPGSRTYGFNGVNGFNNPMLNYVSLNGNLLLLWMGHQVLAIDTLRPGDGAGRVLWSQDLTEQVPGVQVQQGFHQRAVNVPWGLPRFAAQHSDGRPIGSMGPVNFEGVCFQRFRELICADPLTGETLWTRKNVPLGSDVFGDETMLFVAPPTGGEALVLRALDGELLGKRAVPGPEQRMATVGRHVLVWETENGKQLISLRDPWDNEPKWSLGFDSGAKGAVIENEAVGVLEPNGRFVLARLSDGRKIVDQQLEPEAALNGIYLLSSAQQYLLITNTPANNIQANVNVQPAPGGLNNPLVNGRVYAFGRQAGEKLWPQPFPVQQQGLVLTQPSELPLLFFMSHKHTANNAGQHETKTSVLCLDKRTGKQVYAYEKAGTVISNFEAVGDRSNDTVSLLLPQKTITFRLTNDPPPTEEEQRNAANKGILQGIGGAVIRVLERQRIAPPDLDLDDD